MPRLRAAHNLDRIRDNAALGVMDHMARTG